MNDLALIVEHYGRVGSIERLLPEYIQPVDEHGHRTTCWPSAVGVMKLNRIEDLDGKTELPQEILASIIVTRDEGSTSDIQEFHGVMFFLPLVNQKWHDQIHALKSYPSMFETVPVTRLESGRDYVFFARRASRTRRREKRSL